MFRQTLVLLAVSSVALAAIARQPLEKKPDRYKNCDGCWVSKIQKFIPTGTLYPSPTECMGYRCTKTEVLLETCGVAVVEPPCVLYQDKSLPYPDCCTPHVICPQKDDDQKDDDQTDDDDC